VLSTLRVAEPCLLCCAVPGSGGRDLSYDQLSGAFPSIVAPLLKNLCVPGNFLEKDVYEF